PEAGAETDREDGRRHAGPLRREQVAQLVDEDDDEDRDEERREPGEQGHSGEIRGAGGNPAAGKRPSDSSNLMLQMSIRERDVARYSTPIASTRAAVSPSRRSVVTLSRAPRASSAAVTRSTRRHSSSPRSGLAGTASRT